MKGYWAQRGTGDGDETIGFPDRVVLQRTNELRRQEYFSVFGKFTVLRSSYHCTAESAVFPRDALSVIVMDGVFGVWALIATV